MSALIIWLRGVSSIRLRLSLCMVVMVLAGAVVGLGTTRHLWQLQATLDAMADQEVAAAVRLCQAREHAQAIGQDTAALSREVEKLATGRRNQTRDHVSQSVIGLWLTMVGPGIFVMGLMALTIASITGPLKRAQDHTHAISQGDLNRRINPNGQDEISRLMTSMKHMQSALRGMVGTVRESSESMLVATTEIAAGNQDLSSRTEQAVSNLQVTASSMAQLSSSVERSSTSAAQADHLAHTASQHASHGGQVVNSVVQQMEAISQASRRIADITGVIDGIAFQTNILALNAAVEAARAGEQGRGFAVVAGEVRVLAQRSAQAAKEIKGLISESAERVDVGTQKVRDAGGVMNEIVAAIDSVKQAMGQIAHTTQEQAQGIAQVTHAVTDLDHMTQQNAALVGQSAAAADSLRVQAQGLSQAVARFNLGTPHQK